MEVIVDGSPCFLEGIKEFDTRDGDDSFELTGFGGWFDFPPELIASRNEAIKAAWTPELRAEQSARTKLNHRNHEPEVNAKRSASIKKALARPETKAKLSAATTARWAKWRLENAR